MTRDKIMQWAQELHDDGIGVRVLCLGQETYLQIKTPKYFWDDVEGMSLTCSQL